MVETKKIYSENLISFNSRSNEMFWELTNLENLIFNDIDTSKATTTEHMLFGLQNLPTINLSKFDTSNVTDMSYMFYRTENLKSIYVGTNWKINKDANAIHMFERSKTSSEQQLCKPNIQETGCTIS